MNNKEILQDHNERLEDNNTLLTNILNTINNLPEAGGSSSLDVYSTQEVKTNKVWVDGKPIYRLVAETTIGNMDSEVLQFEGYENVKEYVSLSASETWGGKSRLNLPYYSSASDYSMIYTIDEGVAIRTTHSNRRKIIIIEYTKITD